MNSAVQYLNEPCDEGEDQEGLEGLQGVVVAALQAVEGVCLVNGQLGRARLVART